MARAMWTGVIGFGLVSIPVKMFAATESKTTAFHQIHSVCKSQVKELRWCPTCERKVDWGEIVKGYEFEKGSFVEITSEDLASLPVPSKNIISVSAFVQLDAIDPVYYEKSYFLEPDKKGEHPFSLLSQALTLKKMVGIASITIRSRERLCAIRPHGDSILMNTLYYPDEVRIDLNEKVTTPVAIPEKELKLATTLIDMLAGDFKPEEYTDHYREALQELLDAKVQGLEPHQEGTTQPNGKILDLMASLQASLEKAQSKKTEKSEKSEAAQEKNKTEKTQKKFCIEIFSRRCFTAGTLN